jgi:GTPase SAR1 family protein
MIVYDVSQRESFDNVKKVWYEDIKNAELTNVALVLVGNKIDLEEREVTFDEGMKLAEDFGMAYIETSAKTGENVDDAFRMIGLKVIEKFIEMEEISKIVVEDNNYMIKQHQLDYIYNYIYPQKDLFIKESEKKTYDIAIQILKDVKNNELKDE